MHMLCVYLTFILSLDSIVGKIHIAHKAKTLANELEVIDDASISAMIKTVEKMGIVNYFPFSNITSNVCPSEFSHYIKDKKIYQCKYYKTKSEYYLNQTSTLSDCIDNVNVPSSLVVIVTNNNISSNHVYDIVKYSGNIKCILIVKSIITSNNNTSVKITNNGEITSTNGQAYIDLCSTINWRQRVIFTKCSILESVFYFYVPVIIINTIIILLIFYLIRKFTIKKESEIGLVRYEDWGNKRIKKRSKYVATDNTKNMKYSILCCIFSWPFCKSCDQIPLFKSDISVCNENITCIGKEFLDIGFYATGQTACLETNLGKIELTMMDSEYVCDLDLSYYTPKGKLKIDQRWNCDGDKCYNGVLENQRWNELSRPHPGGWFHNCWSFNDQCHTLEFNIEDMEMCEVLNCPNVRKIHHVKIIYNKLAMNIKLTEGVPYNYNNITLLINPNQLSHYGEYFLRCGLELYKISANSANYHDIYRLGYIQCPTMNYTKGCTAKFDDFYKFDYEGKLINVVDLSYKSQLIKITNIDSSIKLDMNYMSSTNLILFSNNTLNAIDVTTGVSIDNLLFNGELLKENGITVSYKCSKKGVNFQFLCPYNFQFSLTCEIVGNNENTISYVHNNKKTRIPCTVTDSLGNEETITIQLNVSLPTIDLLKIDNNPTYLGYSTNLSWSFTGYWYGFIETHYIAFIVLIAWVSLLLIHQIHDVLK